MSFDFATKLNAVYNALAEANTTTAAYDLSTGMATRVKYIEKDDPAVRPAREDEHPFIWLWIDRADQKFDEIGVVSGTGITKRMTVQYKVLATIHKAGMTTQHKTALNEMYVFARNIVQIFQTAYTLSDTCMWIIPRGVEFLPPVGMGGNYIKGAIIDLEAEYLFR